MSIDEKLPDRWVLTTLDDIIIPERILEHPGESSTLQFIGLEHVEAETMRLIGTMPARDLKSAALHFWPGDVLYGRLRPYLNKVLQLDFEGLCSAEFLVFRKLANLNSNYLQYFLNSWHFKEFASQQITGDRPRANWDKLKVFNFPLPPLPEQNRIIDAIEQQFTRLDSAIASLQSAQIRVKQYRASLLKSAVEGELTKEWRVEHPAEETGEQLLRRILIERHKRWEKEQLAKMKERGKFPIDGKWKLAYKEPQGPDIEKLPKLPEGWCWATVEQVVARSEYGTSVKCDYGTDGVPVLRIPNIAAGKIDLKDMKYSVQPVQIDEDSALQVGDLLVCRTNGSISLIGKAALIRTPLKPFHTFASYLLRFRLLETDILPEWFHLFIGSSQGRNFIEKNSPSSAGQHNISLSLLHGMPFPLPPLAEQEQIVAEVEASLSNITKLEETTENNLKRAEHERQSILQEAFAGRLVLQDKNDEPASMLLERIREERKKRAEAEKVVKASRKGDHVSIAKRRKADRIVSGQQNVGLYEKLVEAAQPLAPDDLFKQVGLKADEQPESVERFYEELHADVMANLIGEERPTTDRILLYALEHDDDENIEEAFAEETHKSGEEGNRRTLWDE